MRRSHYIDFVLVLVTVALASRFAADFLEDRVMLDGFFVGQTRASFSAETRTATYVKSTPTEEMKAGETLYRKGIDPETDPFLRVSFSWFDRLKTISGRPEVVSYRNRKLFVGVSSSEEIKSSLGQPTWEKHVGNGTIGLYYRSLALYISVFDNKLSGASLGIAPKKPD